MGTIQEEGSISSHGGPSRAPTPDDPASSDDSYSPPPESHLASDVTSDHDTESLHGQVRVPKWALAVGGFALGLLLCLLLFVMPMAYKSLFSPKSTPATASLPASLSGTNIDINYALLRDRVEDAQISQLLNLYTIDRFSAKAGTVIDGELTSPTLPVEEHPGFSASIKTLADSKWSALSWRRIMYNMFGLQSMNGPTVALKHWNEAGDCWCAKQEPDPEQHVGNNAAMFEDIKNMKNAGGFRDPRGPSLPGSPRAQLALTLPQAVYPKNLIVEHIPYDGTVDISSAPEWMELWVRNDDPDLLDRIWSNYAQNTGETVRPWPEYTKTFLHQRKNNLTKKNVSLFSNAWQWWKRALPEDLKQVPYAGDRAMGPEWVRAARFRYDIHKRPHVQQFAVDVDFEALHIPVQQAMVRVRTNHGAGYTCLYRVRLEGKPAHV